MKYFTSFLGVFLFIYFGYKKVKKISMVLPLFDDSISFSFLSHLV